MRYHLVAVDHLFPHNLFEMCVNKRVSIVEDDEITTLRQTNLSKVKNEPQFDCDRDVENNHFPDFSVTNHKSLRRVSHFISALNTC